MIGGDANGIFSKCKPYYKRKGFAMMVLAGTLFVLVMFIRWMVKAVETMTDLVNAISGFINSLTTLLEAVERFKAVRKRHKKNRH